MNLFTKLLTGFLITGIISTTAFNRERLIWRYMFNKIDKKQITDNRDKRDAVGTKKYIAEPFEMSEDNWLTRLAGGTANNLTIEFGEVTYNENSSTKEYYLDLKGQEEKINLISNGGAYTYYDDTANIKRLEVNFLTGKKLEGDEVVKDYTNGKEKLELIIDYDESGNILSQFLFVGKMNQYQYPIEVPVSNYYIIKAIVE